MKKFKRMKKFRVVTSNSIITVFRTNNIDKAWKEIDRRWKEFKQSCRVINTQDNMFEYR